MTKPDYCPVAQEPCQLMCVTSDVRCKIRDAAQPGVQEPVGEVNRYGLDSHGRKWHGIHWYDPNVDVAHGTKLYTTPPAQPAPVQEPETDSCGSGAGCLYKVAMIENLESEVERLKAAQPAVPDAIIEAGESPDYRDGWNDCRAEMLKGMK